MQKATTALLSTAIILLALGTQTIVQAPLEGVLMIATAICLIVLREYIKGKKKQPPAEAI